MLGSTSISFVSLLIGLSLHYIICKLVFFYHVSATIVLGTSLLFYFKQFSLFVLFIDSYLMNYKLFVLGIVLMFFIVNYFQDLK